MNHITSKILEIPLPLPHFEYPASLPEASFNFCFHRSSQETQQNSNPFLEIGFPNEKDFNSKFL